MKERERNNQEGNYAVIIQDSNKLKRKKLLNNLI